jgi:hypothetical protein
MFGGSYWVKEDEGVVVKRSMVYGTCRGTVLEGTHPTGKLGMSMSKRWTKDKELSTIS